MSRKQERQNQPKVFVSFGDVAGGQSYNNARDEPRAAATIPMYTGSDHELAVIAKKLLKKDHTTKLKAVHDLPNALKGKAEHIVAEFLTYFVYCFPRLCLEDSRVVRQHLAWVIDAVVSVEKRLLAPHMNSLIGPWWMLTGDPASEVAESALAAFNSAIPPKKRQTVLAFLAPHIIKEAQRNVQSRRETLSDMSVSSVAEANERLERVLVSTFAAVGRLLTLLSEEQNQQLSSASGTDRTDDDTTGGAVYAGFVSVQTWRIGFTSEFTHVRKAAYELVSTVATHAPQLLQESAAGPSAMFTCLLLDAARTEQHGPNLTTLFDALLIVLRQVKNFFRAASIGEEVIAIAEYLVRTHPHLAVEYVLPLIGSLPPRQVALLDAYAASGGSSDSSDALVNLLLCLSDLAEKKAMVGSPDTESDAAVPLEVSGGQARSSRNRRLIAARRLAHVRGVQAESASLAMLADICVVELGTLLLLRRADKASEPTAGNGGSSLSANFLPSVQVESVVTMMVQSIVLTAQSAALHHGTGTQRPGQFRTALASSATAVGQRSEATAAAASGSVQSIARSLQQVQRATLKSMHISSAQWTRLFWDPLASALTDLVVASATSTGDLHESSTGGSASSVSDACTAMLGLKCLSDLLVELLLPAWQEKPPADVGAEGEGVTVLLDALHQTLSSLLASTATTSADSTATTALLGVTSALSLLVIACAAHHSQRGGDLAPRTLEAVTGTWLSAALASVHRRPGEGRGIGGVLMIGMRELFALVTELARTDERCRGYEQKILSLCIEADSIEAVSLALVQNSQLPWSASALDWARMQGRSILASTNVGRSQLQFLLLLCRNAALTEVTLPLVEQALRQCESPSATRTTRAFTLTVLAAALKSGTLPAAVQDVVSSWQRTHEGVVHRALTKLFFARVRTREHAGSSQKPGHLSALDSVRVIGDWQDVQATLLPLLSQSARDSLRDAIAAVLNAATSPAALTAQLVAPSTAATASLSAPLVSGIAAVHADDASVAESEVEEPESVGEFTQISLDRGVPAGLQPAKWARHALGLLSLAGVKAGTTETHTGVLDILSAAFWKEYYQQSDQRSPVALEYVGVLQTGLTGSGYRTSPLSLEATFWLLCTIDAYGTSSTGNRYETLRSSCLQGFKASPATEKMQFIEHLLMLVAGQGGDTADTNARSAEIMRGCLQAVLSAELGIAGTVEEVEPIRIQSPSLRRAERPERGAPATFVHWKARSASQATPEGGADGHDGLDRLCAVPCKLAAVHREGGEDPYFTIEIDRTGDAAMAHELQVEWPKLILGRTVPEGAVDLVRKVSDASSLSPRTVESAADASTIIALTHWLQDSLTMLLESKASSARDALLDTFITVLEIVTQSVSALGRAQRDAFEANVVASLRGAVLFLTSATCTPEQWKVGLQVGGALLRSKAGVGHGLWMPALLANLRTHFGATTKPAAEERPRIVALGAFVLAHLLTVAPTWGLCADVTESVISAALPVAVDTQASTSLLGLLTAVWRYRSEQRNDTPVNPVIGDSAAWEMPAFDFALSVITKSPAPSAAGANSQREACLALHYCLYKRGRKSTLDLLSSPSLASQVSQLEQLAFAAGDAVSSRAEELTAATVRLTSCKVLDAWEGSRADRGAASPIKGGAGKADPVEAEAIADDGLTVQQQEQRELEEDTRLMQEIAGTLGFTELQRRFVVTDADATAADDSSTVNGADDEEEDAGDSSPATPVAGEKVSAGRAPTPVGGGEADRMSTTSSAGSGGRKVSRRAALHVMLRRDPLGSLLMWLLLLQRIDAQSVHGWLTRARCVNFLKKTGIATNALFLALRLAGDLLQFKDVSALLPRLAALSSVSVQDASHVSSRQRRQAGNTQAGNGSITQGNLQHLAVYAIFRTICTLPAMFRTFWSDDCNRVQKTRLTAFVEERVRVSLMKREIAMISLAAAAGRWDSNEFTVKGSAVSGEVSAVLSRDETTVEIKVKLPPSYPLKNVEVSCTSRIGVSDGRWRRWVLQIIQLMSMQDGSVVDAVLLWKCNIEKELEGVEPCPICYCTLHTKTLCLPTMICSTCNNKFHSPCLTQWFRSSGKSKCVICQQPWSH